MTEQLDAMIRALPVGRRRRSAIARELHSHYEDSRDQLEAEGLTPEAAAHEALRRLGSPDEIADAFHAVYRPRFRTRVAIAFGLAGAIFVGAYGAGPLTSVTSAHHATVATHTTHAHRHARPAGH
ncbi:MAG TPA: permease prefix domain 1-containing protein [Chloroflexota bacterium]|nr:permease prefix domain 1-containing protein [Chloroflexota bacterium]